MHSVRTTTTWTCHTVERHRQGQSAVSAAREAHPASRMVGLLRPVRSLLSLSSSLSVSVSLCLSPAISRRDKICRIAQAPKPSTPVVLRRSRKNIESRYPILPGLHVLLRRRPLCVDFESFGRASTNRIVACALSACCKKFRSVVSGRGRCLLCLTRVKVSTSKHSKVCSARGGPDRWSSACYLTYTTYLLQGSASWK